MRSWSAGEGEEFDMNNTLERTIHSGGIPQIFYRSQAALPSIFSLLKLKVRRIMSPIFGKNLRKN